MVVLKNSAHKLTQKIGFYVRERYLLTRLNVFYSPLDRFIKFLDYLIIGIHTPYQTRNGSLELNLEYVQAFVILFLIKIHLGILCLILKYSENILTYLKAPLVILNGPVAALYHTTVALSILHGSIEHHILGRYLTVILIGTRSIQRHEYVRHYTAAAIYRAMLNHGAVLERIREMDAVRIGQFAVMQTFQNILPVIHILAVWFLDASAHGSVLLGYGKTYERTVMELYGTLHKTLAE